MNIASRKTPPKTKREQLGLILNELRDEPVANLRAFRTFSDRFYADLFKEEADRLGWDRLNKRELTFLILRYCPLDSGERATFEDVALQFGLVRETARAIIAKAIRKLKGGRRVL